MGDQRPPQKSPPGSCTTAFSVVEHMPNTSSALRSAPLIDHHRASKSVLERKRSPWTCSHRDGMACRAAQSPDRCAEPIQSPVQIPHTYSPNPQLFNRLATNNTDMELIVAVHANILSPTGPGLATEPPRYRRVATAPRPALVPNIARLCRFPGRDAGFGAQRGFRRPPII